MKLTKDFWAYEFVCKCGEKDCDATGMDPIFMWLLQRLRDQYGEPIFINSGRRCLEYNRVVGGATSSFHLLGRAADLRIDSNSDRYRLVQLAIANNFKGIGVGENFLHVDNRDTITPIMWYHF